MKNSTFKILIVLLFIFPTIKSQQIQQLSQYTFNPLIYNPAFSGQNHDVSLYVAARQQWIGYSDQQSESVYPRNYIVGITTPIRLIKSGIGFQFNLEQIGYQTRKDFRLDYAYKIEMQRNRLLSFGISAQLSNLKLDIDRLDPQDLSDPSILLNGIQEDMIPEASLGVCYSSANNWWIGFSALNFLGSQARLGNIILHDQLTFLLDGQYKISIINRRFRKFDLAPSFLLKTNFTVTQAEFDMLGYLNTNYWFGAGYRIQDGLILIGGAHLGDFDIGLSYDVTAGKVAEVTKIGTIELQLRYCLQIIRKDSFDERLKKIKYQSGFNTRHL